ncbi:MAG: replication factor C large subunit, partial [Candidatus Hadarchaeota archaeon]
EDYGGESALRKIIKRNPPQPFILIANEPYKLSPSLRNLCKMINFRRLTPKQIASVLSKIVKREGLEADKDALMAIAKNSGGDLRAAINDLQAIARRKGKIKVEDVDLAKRTQETDIFKVLVKVFKKLDSDVYYDSMLLDETPEDLVTWVEENLPLEYSGEELFRGYMTLSNADIYLGRVRRRQYYRLWKYAGYLITAGVQQVKDEERGGFTRYRRPEVWKKLFQTKSRRVKLDKILAKIGKRSHLSKSSAYSEMYYSVSMLLSRLETEKAAGIAAFYEFDEEDLAFILGDEKRAEEIAEYSKEVKEHQEGEKEPFQTFKSKSKSKPKSKPKPKSEEKAEKGKEEREEKTEDEDKRNKKSKDTTTTLDFFS